MEPRISVLKLLLVLHKCGKPNLWYLWTFNTWILGEWYSSKPYLRSYCGWFMVSVNYHIVIVSHPSLTHPTRFLTPTAVLTWHQEAKKAFKKVFARYANNDIIKGAGKSMRPKSMQLFPLFFLTGQVTECVYSWILNRAAGFWHPFTNLYGDVEFGYGLNHYWTFIYVHCKHDASSHICSGPWHWCGWRWFVLGDSTYIPLKSWKKEGKQWPDSPGVTLW